MGNKKNFLEMLAVIATYILAINSIFIAVGVVYGKMIPFRNIKIIAGCLLVWGVCAIFFGGQWKYLLFSRFWQFSSLLGAYLIILAIYILFRLVVVGEDVVAWEKIAMVLLAGIIMLGVGRFLTKKIANK